MALLDKPNMKEVWASGGATVKPSDEKIQTGWTAEVPPYQYENWIQSRQDQYLAHVNQRGIPQWDGLTEYEGGGLSYTQGSDGVVYKSVTSSGPSGTVQDPTTDVDNTYWERAFPDNGDSRLSDAREWTATTVSQAEAEAGTSTTPRKWTAQRVRQAVVAWFNGISGALGRTILSRTTAAQVRSDIGLGTAATKDVTTSNTDSTAGRVMTVGALGWGGPSLVSSSYDAQDPTTPTRLTIFPTDLFGAGSGSALGMHLKRVDQNAAAQFGFNGAAGRMFFRTAWQGDWVPPREVLHTGNTLQTTGTSTGFPMSQAAVTGRLLGVGQTWQDVTDNRAANTSYTNSSEKAIEVIIEKTSVEGEGIFQVYQGGVWNNLYALSGGPNSAVEMSAIIPPGASYRYTGDFTRWMELR